MLSVPLMVCMLTGPICRLQVCSYDSFYARLFEAVSGQCQFQTVLLANQVLQACTAIIGDAQNGALAILINHMPQLHAAATESLMLL